MLGKGPDGPPCGRMPRIQAIDDEDDAPTGVVDLVEQRLDVLRAASREPVKAGNMQDLGRLAAKLIHRGLEARPLAVVPPA